MRVSTYLHFLNNRSAQTQRMYLNHVTGITTRKYNFLLTSVRCGGGSKDKIIVGGRLAALHTDLSCTQARGHSKVQPSARAKLAQLRTIRA